MSHRYLIFGPQGSGKGTQAAKLAMLLGIPHISPGALYREAVAKGSPIGQEAKQFLDQGQLCPDELTNRIVAERLGQPDAQAGFILDGYPRDLAQADAMDNLAPVDQVIVLDLPVEAAIARMDQRQNCPKGHSFHPIHNPPKTPGVCDYDRLPLGKRSDDTPEAVRQRLAIYQEQTEPLLDRYQDRLLRVDGTPTVAEVAESIRRGLGL